MEPDRVESASTRSVIDCRAAAAGPGDTVRSYMRPPVEAAPGHTHAAVGGAVGG